MDLVGRGITLENKNFFEHFKELNYRVISSVFIVSIFFTIVYINYSSVYEILTAPLSNAGYSTDELIAFTIYEGFQVKILNTFLCFYGNITSNSCVYYWILLQTCF